MAKTTAPLMFNRELSWLAFNQRVLDEALDPGLPALERLKFLAITASNLDEFFMVRVGGLQQLLDRGRDERDPSGMTTDEQLAAVSGRVHAMAAMQQDCLQDIRRTLVTQGLRFLESPQLSPTQLLHVEQVFQHEVFPLLTPLAASSPAPFPPVPGLTLCLAVRLRSGKTRKRPRFAIVPLPRSLSRIVNLESGKGAACLLLEDAVRLHLDRFFPGETILDAAMFRVTRNADMAVREDLAGDLLSGIRQVLTQRRESACVRLELGAAASPECRLFLKQALAVHERDIYEMDSPLALGDFLTLGLTVNDNAPRAPLWDPRPSPSVPAGESMFSLIARQDLLLYHPFESFEPIQRLIEQAAEDSDVLAIKQILYRTSPNSPIVAALMRAAQLGKQVTVIVELKARFDEARNINWAEELERAGAQVIYGIKGLKTHAKLCLIIRRETTGIRRYLHFGTGNYNERTARIYTDASLMTCNDDLAADASLFFNTITGYSQPVKYRKIEAAPIGLRDRLLELIEGESARASQGQKSWIMAKLNSLVDPLLIGALYAASQAGVRIKLNVRGICCLRPGVPRLSENISVVSIVDRFLEHSRILYFHHGGEPQVFITSADWMPRNLDRRIELLVPVEDEACRNRLVAILETCLKDTVKGQWLQAEGTYIRIAESGAAPGVRSQQALFAQACARQEDARVPAAIFQPHRPSPPMAPPASDPQGMHRK
jgi:polyphosphate kinase